MKVEPATVAMLLLAVLVVTPSLCVLVIVVRCSIWLVPECLDRPWVPLFRDWLGETIPILVAIVMSRKNS